MPLVGGADLNGTASGDPTDLRFNRSYRASPTGLHLTGTVFASGLRPQLCISRRRGGVRRLRSTQTDVQFKGEGRAAETAPLETVKRACRIWMTE
eukprot:6212933-Pleurochrysis_carterae.AAC.2